MVAMAESRVIVSNIEWKITVPEGSIELKPLPIKRLHERVLETILVFDGWKSNFISLCKMAWRHGADDKRRFAHPIKVGISLVLVSLFYFIRRLYNSTGGEATWAIMTVVVVFEFTAGATLSKGLNRMVATLLGALLAYAVNVVARTIHHRVAEAFIISIAVFFLSLSSTFVRLFPKIKARFDYGFMIFVLTFSFIAVSGYRDSNLFKSSYERLETIIIGCIICLLTSLLICPVWAGEDLHKLIISNFESLAESLEGCVTEYFKESSDADSEYDNVSIAYRCVLNSKATEESLANFARWEYPAHGQFGFNHPWKQYVKIGARMRYCAYCVEALNVCLNSEIQAPYFLREYLKAPCLDIVAESSKVILELAVSIKTMTRSTKIDLMTDRLNRAVEELQNCLTSKQELFIDSKSWQIVEETQVKKNETIQGVAFMETLPLATVACLLIEIVPRLQTLIIAVDELAERADFNNHNAPTKISPTKQFPYPLGTAPAAAETVIWRWSV